MKFENWYQDLLMAVAETPVPATHELFERVRAAATSMGFEHCAFGIRLPFPLTRPRVEMLNNYPAQWQQRYMSMNYAAIDPSVALASRSNKPALWSEQLTSQAPEFWAEARDAGLHHGWFQSTSETSGVIGMLTLSRSSEPICASEMEAVGTKLSWLAYVVHHVFANALMTRGGPSSNVPPLTSREVEILRWTADGKTSGQISDILAISDNTVNFHIKNAITKLKTSNKTSAAVRAAMMGILA